MHRPLHFARLSLACALCAGVALAAGSAPVVVGSLSLSPAELAARLGRAQAAGELGTEPGRASLAYVEQTLVPELLLRAEADRLGIAKSPAFAARERDVLFRALASAEAAQVGAPSQADIDAYYEAHKADFTRPRRLRLWRILVASEDDAKKLITDVKGALGPERWREASRKLSKDSATRDRGGDLGFVHADGFTDVPELRVDKALFAAADKVEDGALVPEPVREGADYAVIWRRGTLTETSVPVEAARDTIARLLVEKRSAERIDQLARELSKAHVSEKKPELVDKIDVPAF